MVLHLLETRISHHQHAHPLLYRYWNQHHLQKGVCWVFELGIVLTDQMLLWNVHNLSSFVKLYPCVTFCCNPMSNYRFIDAGSLFDYCTGLRNLRSLINSSFYPIQPALPVYARTRDCRVFNTSKYIGLPITPFDSP